jgi:hypothetical protein
LQFKRGFSVGAKFTDIGFRKKLCGFRDFRLPGSSDVFFCRKSPIRSSMRMVLFNPCLTAQFAGSRRVESPAAGLADGDLFGLNKRGNLSLNLWGVGDATGVGVGLASTSVVFLRMSRGVGEAAGDSAAEGNAVLSTGGVASAFFVRCFGGERDSVGVPVSSCD